jgi:hypothetical protein
MVARKTYTLTKKTYKKKKSYRKKPMMYKTPKNNTLSVKRVWNWTTFVPSAATTAGFWQYIGFSPNALPDWTQYTNIFDEFKINSLKFVLYPRYTEVPIAGQPQVYLTYIIDPQSLLIPSGTYSRATYNTLTEQSRVKIRSGNRPVTIFIRYPKMSDAINGNISQKSINTWVNTNSGGNQIYKGFHLFFNDANFSGSGFANVSYDVTITAYMQFRNIK